jgi:hypothetical protein
VTGPPARTGHPAPTAMLATAAAALLALWAAEVLVFLYAYRSHGEV